MEVFLSCSLSFCSFALFMLFFHRVVVIQSFPFSLLPIPFHSEEGFFDALFTQVSRRA
jgi:hypothetical protein